MSTFLCVSVCGADAWAGSPQWLGGSGGKPGGPASRVACPCLPRAAALRPHMQLLRGPGLPDTCGWQATSWTPRLRGHTLKFDCAEFQAFLGRLAGPTPPFRRCCCLSGTQTGSECPLLPLGRLWRAPEAKCTTSLIFITAGSPRSGHGLACPWPLHVGFKCKQVPGAHYFVSHNLQ